MLFNSLQFLVFFCIVTAAYFALPRRTRWPLLLIASCYFYMVLVPSYILILFFLILVDYAAGIFIEQSQGARRKLILVLSLIANIGMLAFFKYFNFIDNNLAELFHLAGWNYPSHTLSIILPIGLSFHTFQSMSYTIEVYRGHHKAERHLGIYALYVLFYPQMVAGPIERPGNLLHQFHEMRYGHVSTGFDYQRVADGLKLMVWGLFKKVVIADRVSILVNEVYNHPTDHTGMPLLLATYFFAIQIYCDFSGYTDIALGAAQVMGIKLMTNFNRPYYAKSIAEFWKRWHISLSTWFKDYLYIPLGGNRVGPWRWYFNLFFVFVISGLWHGASWTFVVWGALHGLYLVSSIWTASIRSKIGGFFHLDRYPIVHKYIRILLVFHMVLVGWIFFRAKTISEAWYILTHLFDFNGVTNVFSLGLDKREMVVALLAILVMESVHYVQRKSHVRHVLAGKPALLRWSLYIAIVLVILVFGEFTSQDFIYFQF
ncbi:MAG: MBOAT family O-acyltransferase [bacterium]